ncbi:hypothetical protein [Oscillibacter sp.]|uniref:hypothetical protein n=1 Tax=Oscillibacter sp. TaxID=1945593 RepID=UPI00289923C2|nr:hypothetical protein [Oscillibacter sp.]
MEKPGFPTPCKHRFPQLHIHGQLYTVPQRLLLLKGENTNMRFMIKYGKESHLQQIIDGKIRFSPSQTYIKIEETQHNKGQGDLLEGKMKLRIERARIHDPDTDKLIGILPPCTMLFSIQDVNNMPVFCLSQYNDDDITSYIDERNFSIALANEKTECIKTDFPDATHALIILEPDKFVNDILHIQQHCIFSDKIKYYEYDINPLQMYMYLATGQTELQKNTPLSMTYENRYRHLLCKDMSFSKQQEYRFIVLDELITEASFYTFSFTSKYLLVPIEELSSLLDICL